MQIILTDTADSLAAEQAVIALRDKFLPSARGQGACHAFINPGAGTHRVQEA